MATAFFRTLILYLLLIAGLRISGKRQIGELETIELVLTLLIWPPYPCRTSPCRCSTG